MHVVEIVEMDDEELWCQCRELPNENQWVKDSERKWNERKRNVQPLVTMDTDSLSREENNMNNFHSPGSTRSSIFFTVSLGLAVTDCPNFGSPV
jgi:hypothetical protein